MATIIAVLVIGGVYIYENKKIETPAPSVEINMKTTNSIQRTSTENQEITAKPIGKASSVGVKLTINNFTPNFTSALQPAIIYKTSGDYSALVPVTLNDQKTQVTSYPDIKDVYYSGYANTQLAYPTKLDNGYLLDNRGISANSAFLKYTYDQYSKLSKTPSSAELFSSILVTSPFLEMYNCGARSFAHDTEQQTISEINALIIDSNQLDKCKRII